MNILVLNYEYPPLGGGGATVSRDLAENMVRLGHRVTVVTMGYRDLPAEETVNGVRIIRMKCLRAHLHSSFLYEHLLYLQTSILFLRRHLKSNHYDLCHAHFIFPTGLLARWIRKYAGIPYIITAHGSDVPGHNRKRYVRALHFCLGPVWKKTVQSAYAAVSPSWYLIRLMQQTMNSEKYVHIPNGLDLEKYKASPETKERRILLMGRLQKNKSLQCIFKAAAMVPDEIWDGWHIDILGDGSFRSVLEKLTDELGIRSRISFHGWIGSETPEQLDLIRKAAVYISGSRFENCPRSVIESMTAGCYPLLTDIEGHRQFFPDAAVPDQYFFPLDNAEALAEKLTDILQKEPSALYCEFDMQMYSLERITEKYMGLFEKAVRECNSGSFPRKVK